MTKVLDQTWNLDVFFDGGSGSEVFSKFLDELQQDVHTFYSELQASHAPTSVDEAGSLFAHISTYENLAKHLRQAGAFLSCLQAQDMNDKKANELSNFQQSISAVFSSCSTLLNTQIGDIPDEVWQALLETDELKAVRFPLEERRHKAKHQLPSDQEQLVNSLSVDGYHGWGELYDTIVGQMTVDFDHPKKGKLQLSIGQLANFLSSSDRSVRQAAFAKWEEAWGSQSEFISTALNRLAGFRLSEYKQRGWDSVLKEPLEYNRMTDKTLEAMWGTIESYKPYAVKFLKKKAELLGLEKLDWYDVGAPLSTEDKEVPYEEASDFVVEQFSTFNPKLGEFAKNALDNRWVEAEDRAGKRPGGFCTSFPLSEESRIFMTYSGTGSNMSTLAHELGHAYHQHVMKGVPYLNQAYAMNVAETASTFAEQIVSDAAIRSAETTDEQLALLEDKIGRAVSFFMNIHARFLFETRFYDERKNGWVSAERLNELMVQAQKDAYCDELNEYHPTFWGSKLHFYITGRPFYNFPYTFGYMFSTGIYARALEEGPSFAEKYDALLQDTGSMTVEDLAKKHLDVDLEQPDFWKNACEQVVKDIDLFLSLTEK